MKEKVKIAYVGLGRRGIGFLRSCIVYMADIEIPVICDLTEKGLEAGKKILLDNGRPMPKMTTSYDDVLNDPEIDAIILMTAWENRAELTKKAMLAGKYIGIEVGCAKTLEECFELIDVYEKTGTPVMMLENCCYGRREMMALNMAKKGLLGEIVHCTGAYAHYLNEAELFLDMLQNPDVKTVDHYRLKYYIEENRHSYPTHDLGPICKVLNINRGNRLVKLSSFASKSAGLKSFAAEHFGEDCEYAKIDYKQGDIINTVLTCENGETIVLTLDTTLPRAHYSRNFSVRGTKGMTNEDTRVVHLAGEPEEVFNNEAEMFEKYDHPLHAEYKDVGPFGGHGGIDWLVARAFIEAVKNGTNTPIDIYDTVTLMAVGPLSDMSIKAGGAPVEFPDFTRGKWNNREPVVKGKYCLDEICEDKTVSISGGTKRFERKDDGTFHVLE